MGSFNKNILFVFLGTSLVNFFNLLYQLLIAHRLSPVDFAAVNSLLSIFMLISAPLATFQTAIAKYSAEFNARGENEKIRVLFRKFLAIASGLALASFFVFYFASDYITKSLKIYSTPSGYILAVLVSVSLLSPVFCGILQGLELFGWLISASLISGILKLLFAFIFIICGFNIGGALGAFLFSVVSLIAIGAIPIKGLISFHPAESGVNFKEIFFYLFPVTVSSFCYMNLVNSDMVMVKYFFSPQDSAFYSLAQMAGKIFLFLPGAISIVMFPRVSGLNAKNMDTRSTLKASLFYGAALSIFAAIFYNIFPGFTLKLLTGKVFPESIALGRLFSISMSIFSLLFILITYFLSLKDLRFIKYLVLFTLVQFLAVIFYHPGLIQVQLILCLNAIVLFFIHLGLFLNRR